MTWVSGPRYLALRSWVWGPEREVSGPGSQDLGFRPSKALHPTVVLSFSRHFSLRPPSLFFFPSLFSASIVTFLFPVTFLCVHRHFSLRPVVTDGHKHGYLVFFKTRLRTTEISTLIPTVTDRLTAHWLTNERWLKLYRGRMSGPVLSYKICLSVRPTVRAGSAGGLKRRTVASDRRTQGLSEFIYKTSGCPYIRTLWSPWCRMHYYY
jgi:hypothetical protein